ncbi:hypothetical protein ACVWWN_003526 [Mycobacterium sp. URHB0021]|jgi:hypothetical protein
MIRNVCALDTNHTIARSVLPLRLWDCYDPR